MNINKSGIQDLFQKYCCIIQMILRKIIIYQHYWKFNNHRKDFSHIFMKIQYGNKNDYTEFVS